MERVGSLEQMKTLGGSDVVMHAGWSFRLMTVLTMTAGSCFVMWLGEQITDRGIGNGASLIITAGIIAGFPTAIMQMIQKLEIGEINLLEVVLLGAGMFGVVMAIVHGAFVGMIKAKDDDYLDLTPHALDAAEQCVWEAVRR